MLNIKEKKLHHSKFLTLDHVFSVIRYSIFKIEKIAGLLASCCYPNQRHAAKDQHPATSSQPPETSDSKPSP